MNFVKYFEYAKKDAEAINAYTAAANNAAYQEATRAEAAAFLCRFCEYHEEEDGSN